jgi:hypothetical protein
MEEDLWEQLSQMSDRELFDFVTEKDSSQRKWVATHLLELRRNRELTEAAKSSARAAWIAAGLALVSALAAIGSAVAAYLWHAL